LSVGQEFTSSKTWKTYLLDACKILRFPSETKNDISPSEINIGILSSETKLAFHPVK